MAKKPVAAVAPAAPAEAPEVGNYLVGVSPILQDGERFESGATITCTAAQAARLGLKPAPLDLPNLEGADQ